MGRKLLKDQNLDRNEITSYVMLSQKGYQVNRDTVSEHDGYLNSMYRRDNFDPVQQVIRMDLAYSASGAAYGADSDKPQNQNSYDVNRTIVNLISKAGERPSTTELSRDSTQLDKLKRFESLYRPDIAVQSINDSK